MRPSTVCTSTDAIGADFQDDLDAAHDVVERHRGLRRPAGRPARACWGCAGSRRASGWDGSATMSISDIENVVAHEGAGGVRDGSGQPRLAHLRHAGLDRQGGEMRRPGPSFTTGLSIGCLPSLSRMRASWTLIAHPLQAKLGAAARLAHAQHDLGLHVLDGSAQHDRRVGVGRRQLGGVHDHTRRSAS